MTTVSVREGRMIAGVLEAFHGLTNAQAYARIFSKWMMRPVPGRESEFYGCDHRLDMQPFVRRLVADLPENGEIFDVGAGAGDVVDFALKDARAGTVINLQDPNRALLDEYLERIKRNPHLKQGIVYRGPLQDYYERRKPVLLPHKPQNLILAMHMIYHLSDFVQPDVKPEQDLETAVSFLYDRLAPGGSIFICYADLSDGEWGEAVCGMAEKYFRNHFPQSHYADNLVAIYRARNSLLGPNGTIGTRLAERFPDTKPEVQAEWRMCHFFGETIADIAVLGLATELCSVDNDLFDLDKLRFCLDYVLRNGNRMGLTIEQRDVPQRGLWRAFEPHVMSVITKAPR